jgi:pre-mRNA-splicing factor CWC26
MANELERCKNLKTFENIFRDFDEFSDFRVKIIDDDEYGHNESHEIDESELFATNEEAPQIVGIIDERAPEVMMKQEYQESGKWKKLGDTESSSKKAKHKKQSKRSQSIDPSPSRKGNRKNSPDNSPPRKRTNSSDVSPPRRISVDESPPRRKRKDSSDASPPRRATRRDSDASPPRRSRQSPRKRRNSSDISPPRRPEPSKRRKETPDASPPRRRRDSDASPPRREIKRERDSSPPRRRSRSRQRKSRWSPEIKREPKSPSPPRSSRMTKTLDGKASGLQDAKTLKRENDEFKARQEKLFREMRPEMSGRDADLVIRDRRGRNKEFELDMEGEKRKAEAEAARKKEYDRWGKGLKQIDDMEKRYQEHMHEASKPLARSADDADLRDHLRNQERIDDPMLEYMRKKKQDESRKKGIEEKPKYLGQFPDNRFNIRPGYRWDGVDRSNGYEKKYFMMINSKKSFEEDAYRYSTEDM